MAMITANGVVMPDPSSLQYNLQGVSAPDAGRAESLRMYTGKKGEVKKYSIAWNQITPEQAKTILDVFRPASYVTIKVQDPSINRLSTNEYYVSDITCPFQQWFVNGKRYSKLSFDIIERK